MKRFIYYVRCRTEFSNFPLNLRFVIEAETHERAWLEVIPAILERLTMQGVEASQLDFIELLTIEEV